MENKASTVSNLHRSKFTTTQCSNCKKSKLVSASVRVFNVKDHDSTIRKRLKIYGLFRKVVRKNPLFP